MKKSFKISIVILFSIFIVLLGLTFYAYKKLSPEEIKKITIETLNETFQKSKTQLGEVKVNFGLIFEIGFNGLSVENDKGEIFLIKEVKAKVPFYSVLLGVGAIELNLSGMKINYIETPSGSNWKIKKDEKKSDGSNLSFIFAAAKLNVKIKDLNIFYALKTGKNGELILEEADFYNLNFLTKTKYKVKSLIKGKEYSFHAKGDGEIDLSRYWKEKVINGNSLLILSDFKFKSLTQKNPDIQTSLSFSYDSQGRFLSDIEAFLGKDKIFSSKLNYLQGVSNYDPFRVNLPLEKLIPVYGNLKFTGNQLNISGKLKMSDSEINPDLSFTWEKGPILKNYKSSSKLKGNVKNNQLEMEILAEILEGSVKVGVTGKINYQDPKKAGPFKIDVLLKNLKINAPAVEKPGSNPETHKKSKDALVLIPATINLTFEKISLMENLTSGNGSIILGENYIKIPRINFMVGKGKGDISSQVYFKGERKEGNFNAGFGGIDLKILNPYFPKGVGVVTGSLFGKFSGNFSKGEREAVITNGVFDLKAKDGAIKDFKMEKHIVKVLESLPFLANYQKEQTGSWVTGDFQDFELNGRINGDLISLDRIHFLGINQKIEMKGKGEINKTDNSQVMVDFIDKKGGILGKVKKYTGDTLKFKFVGKGYDLNPDYGFTINAVGKDALKANQGKLEEAGKKFLDKLFKK